MELASGRWKECKDGDCGYMRCGYFVTEAEMLGCASDVVGSWHRGCVAADIGYTPTVEQAKPCDDLVRIFAFWGVSPRSWLHFQWRPPRIDLVIEVERDFEQLMLRIVLDSSSS